MGEKLLEWLYGVLASPVRTLNEIAREKPVGLAFLVYLGVAVLVMASNIFGDEGFAVMEESMAELGIFIASPVIMIGTAIFAVVSIFILTALLHLFARLFGGAGGYWNLFSAYAFADFPMIISAPITLIAAYTGTVGAIFGGLITFGLSIWVIVLQVIALRESHGLSTGASIGAYVIHLVILIVIPVAIAVAVVAAVFLAA